jgi:uncharacterized protein
VPEYLSPGVYVEETSFRSKTIEGVATSTTGFVGLTRWGPVKYDGGPPRVEPRLITSFTEFERVYGGLEKILAGGERESYVGHAARAFFANGGKRLYVSRVFVPSGASSGVSAATPLPVSNGNVSVSARWPGVAGSDVTVRVKAVRTPRTVVPASGTSPARIPGIVEKCLIEVANPPKKANDDITVASLSEYDPANPAAPVGPVSVITLTVEVEHKGESPRTYDGLSPFEDARRSVFKILGLDAEDEDAEILVKLNKPVPIPTVPPAPPPAPIPYTGTAANVLEALVGATAKPTTPKELKLTGGDDGGEPTGALLAGQVADPDDPNKPATGLAALGDIDDIAIVAMPDSGFLGGIDASIAAVQALVRHCEELKYRIAVVDAPVEAKSLSAVRHFRGQFDSKYGALYHPWIEILDPLSRPSQGFPQRRIMLPPSGFVTGIYARSDIERGVYKAPANEVIYGLNRFEMNINKGRQDVLNPEGINALRFFEGRGNRIWGARCMTSDPEWKYVNVRRFFIYLEHSLDKATQWAVFEPNNERLWRNIRETVEDFLYIQWRDGALIGAKPEDAYFVRCDRTTMAQNDLDNGRLICLVGVAPTKPAEFVIFRVGQWTADSKA